jgi:polyphosphate kinase 2 (PPK2 family)
MTIVTYEIRVSHRYYMRKTKSDIIDRIDMMREQLKLPPLDKSEIKNWDKYSLASEAMSTHRLFPE